MKNTFIIGCGSFLPGKPISNEQMATRLGIIHPKQLRVGRRILRQNGIQQRHYALDEQGHATHLNEELAVHAIKAAVKDAGISLPDVEALAWGSSTPDVPVPGIASMIHGRMQAHPMEVASMAGICCSGMAALKAAWQNIGAGMGLAIAGASECAGRVVRKCPQQDSGDDNLEPMSNFEGEFLKWMLSDGAGAVVLSDRPRGEGLSLRVDWIQSTSYAGEYPPCMYYGLSNKNHYTAGDSWLDYPSFTAAERQGLTQLRQDTRILPNIFKVGVEELLRLTESGQLDIAAVDHFLLHYSSHLFRSEVLSALAEAGILIPETKWFSNLYDKGNTGAASIFIMLDEALHTNKFKLGEQILLMVPESGRFMVSMAMLTVVDTTVSLSAATTNVHTAPNTRQRWQIKPTHTHAITPSSNQTSLLGPELEQSPNQTVQWLARELTHVWLDFERMLSATPIIQRIEKGQLSQQDYLDLLCNLRQQVVDGARWIARASSSFEVKYFELRALILHHAVDEHRDFTMLEKNYVAVGGELSTIQNADKNIGSEALSAFIFHRASQPNPIDLLGAMFIIEGLGKAKVGQWAVMIQEQLKLGKDQVSFMLYHQENDESHFDKLRHVIQSGLVDQQASRKILKTAKTVARLYALQLEELNYV